MRKKYYLFIIVFLYLTSVLIRTPYIDRPLSVRYEWVTAHTLVTVGIWMEEGIIEHKFNPIYTFPNPNDHHIKCPISGVSDDEGNYYYVSYPPFSFILPFFLFKLSGLAVSPLNLQIFNLFLHFFCSLLIYLIVKQVLNNKTTNYPALVGTAVYIFATPNLWYHTNVYFADILVQFFFLISILLYLKLGTKSKYRPPYILLLFSLSVFLMVYTEWLGFLLAITFFLHAFFISKKRRIALLIVLITTIGLATIVLQYSAIAGIEDYVNVLLDRYAERSGSTGSVSILDPAAHLKLATIYMRNFFPLFILILFGITLIAIYRQKNVFHLSKIEKSILLITTIPVILHHCLLFQFTIIHELSLVKSTIPLSLTIAFLTQQVLVLTRRKDLNASRYLYFFICVAMISLSVFIYYSHIIKPNEYLSLRLGTQIKDTSSPDDTIFFKTTKTLGGFLIQAPDNFVMAPQIQYYAERCIQVVPNEESALEHLKRYNKTQGVIYTVDNSLFKIEAVNRIQNNNTVNE